MPPARRYRLYLDESGDHTYSDSAAPGKRYLALVGCVIESEHYRQVVHPAVEALKQRHFPHSPDEPVILHRKDVVNARGPFRRLMDADARMVFNRDVISLLTDLEFLVVAVVLDKLGSVRHLAPHPYHVCLHTVLESYVRWLNERGVRGDVMAESRGGREDRSLKGAYTAAHESGTRKCSAQAFQRALTSRDLKLKPKAANIAGLQLADVLAHPCRLDVLSAEGLLPGPISPFNRRIAEAVAERYLPELGSGAAGGRARKLIT